LARRVVLALCRILRRPAVRDDAALIVSEMVGNSIRAACGDTILLRLDWTPRRLRIEVHDDAPGQPQVVHASPEAEGGRGMWIVSQLAVRWGITLQRPGKVVWAELALPQLA
jgi:anti-sigma regulatory factor (Ser/Thr protein kinase)